MTSEGQSAGYEGIMAMLQTYLDREAKMEEEVKLIQQSILKNEETIEIMKASCEDVNSSIAMSIPQNEFDEEEISNLQDEPKIFCDNNESCESEEVVQLEEEQNLEEEVSNYQKEEIEEILKSIMGRNEKYRQVLTKLWEEVQHVDDEATQKVNLTMDGFLQALNIFHLEEKLDREKILSLSSCDSVDFLAHALLGHPFHSISHSPEN
ncbi:hypothetical protein K7X08_033921 [Anisodus acutangulus]|uniref:Uncharacterized protein n=1 Tax=Anisodus acutangulus TaxID=402998 RepID=A0A9Q1MW24_9SOLA|nr:hypothetical protein K7X08_033921 [Anisodus acutangulus]